MSLQLVENAATNECHIEKWLFENSAKTMIDDRRNQQ